MSSTEEHYLRALSYRFPTVEAALAEAAHLGAVLALPVGTSHIVSDVHGEYRKLEHIVRNGSGTLRVLVDSVLGATLDDAARTELLSLLYYPREAWGRFIVPFADPAQRERAVAALFERGIAILRAQARVYSLRHIERIVPSSHHGLVSELLLSPLFGRDPAFVTALLAPFVADDGGLELWRTLAHAIRSLASYELIVAGDLGDRGPRIDRVIETLRRQWSSAIVWGNHDAEWMGACLGQEALIATVLRISLRYGRTAQLEEGYGIPLEPLEQLARLAYADDPAARFASKGEDLREPLLLARMQKAAAILQFKLEGQTIARHPDWQLDARTLLHRIDPQAGTVTLDGKPYPLLDTHFPTIDWRDPYRLSDAEAACLAALRRAFFDSASLWRDMRFVVEKGAMWLRRDEHVIFHGCLPCDPHGAFVDLSVDGTPRHGRALLDALDTVVRRAFVARDPADVDLLYYLWAGPRSPLFGKDKMATFETYFVADKATHKETKDPYFGLIHDKPFCESVARELGVEPPERVLIVNGHVPVRLDDGESPVKRSGLAVTIDGAFSEAYGDKGYTLVIAADRTYLAQHHHFESVDFALEHGADIVPKVNELRRYDPPRRVADTQKGNELREEIAGLLRLVAAYRTHAIQAPPTSI